jgi:hypothetical protein
MASKQISASTNSKIVSALSPAFKAAKAVKTFVSQAKGVAGIGSQAVEAGKAIGANTKQLQDFKEASENPKVEGSYKKGGKVKKAGIYRLHAKERVLNAKQTKKMESKGGLRALLGGDTDKDGK